MLDRQTILQYGFEGLECGTCSKSLWESGVDTDLTPEPGQYVGKVICDNCNEEYDIEIELTEDEIFIETHYTDLGMMCHFDTTSLSHIHKQEHPIADLVDALEEISRILLILKANWDRVIDHIQSLRESSRGEIDELDWDEAAVDLHNYLSSSYLFHKIKENVSEGLPTGEISQEVTEAYQSTYKPIFGLRLYSQKSHVLKMKVRVNAQHRDGIRFISVNLDELREGIDYHRGFDHHYGSIAGEFIDVDRLIDSHTENAENWFGEVESYVSNDMSGELKDYSEKATLVRNPRSDGDDT